MRIKADWLKSNGPAVVSNMLQQAGYKIYFVGGCVRNGLLNIPVNDIDMATDALPEKVMALANAHNLRVIPTGIEHGTVTFVINGETVEVTTFRKDIATDGRRAVVGFSTSIEDDAKRRDFTMNALYADLDGTVIDPLSGLDDLRARRVRFIEDPNARIREDYLRILRFFRFHALYGDPNAGIDAEALAACAQNLEGIKTLSKERVGHEMRKLLAADDPAPSIAAMVQTGVLMQVMAGTNATSFAPLIHLEKISNTKPKWMRRLLVLGGDDVKNEANAEIGKRTPVSHHHFRVGQRYLDVVSESGPLRLGQVRADIRDGAVVTGHDAFLRTHRVCVSRVHVGHVDGFRVSAVGCVNRRAVQSNA